MSEKERIIDDYRSGMSTSEVAAKYGRSVKGLTVCFARWGVVLPEGERVKRLKAHFEKRACVSKDM